MREMIPIGETAPGCAEKYKKEILVLKNPFAPGAISRMITVLQWLPVYTYVRVASRNSRSGRAPAISYGTALRTENERFGAEKTIINLMGSKPVIFRLFFSVFIFGTASNRKWAPFFDQHPRSKLASGFGSPHIVGGNKR